MMFAMVIRLMRLRNRETNDDMLRELEVAEEEDEERDRIEEGEDETHLPDQMVECFRINTYTTRGRGGKQRSQLSTLSTLRHIDLAIKWDHVSLCLCLCACR